MISGRVWKFGDDVNTDVIMPGKYLAMRNPAEIAPYIMEGIDPDFARKAQRGDVIVGGRNFGCGSSRETAPAGLHAFGIAAVIAASFGRIFFRNSINIGLPLLECPEAAQALAEGAAVTVDVTTGAILDGITGRKFQAAPFPPALQELIRAGGLVPYVRQRLASTTR
ncbi:MAG TPA: 3-isopropylmalate dehydratase small subunit [Methylomirabilota bacterium]|jgi:3-isopropylmalate/(R)-2-methylmalate dehydratase small subunit|nr:3-isopropylmalate dehydratase small subunit [Methylomirabilota bacterium]